MPALPKELVGSLYQQGAMIYGGRLQIPANQQTNVERAFERYREILENAVSGASAPAPTTQPSSETGQPQGSAPGSRPNLTTRITEALTSTPSGMTVGQLARRLKVQNSSVERIVARQVTSGTYVKEGNKYRMSTGAAPAAAAPAAARTRARQSGSGALDRVVNLVMQRPGITKAEVITAMAPDRANHVGIWLSRLCKSNRITGTQDGTDGPYYPTATAQRAAA